MSYVPDATLKTEPQDSQKASTAALEFRTLKTYIADVLLPAIAEKFGPGGGTISGPIISTYSPAITVKNDVGQLLFRNTADTNTTGTLTFTYDDFIQLSAVIADGIRLAYLGHTVTFDGLSWSASSLTDLGKSTERWSAVYGVNASFTGQVSAEGGFYGDGSNLTGVPAGTLTGAAIITALGYTPYPTSNPANYQAADGHVLEANYALTAGTAAKTTTVAKDGTGIGMYFYWSAGAGSQPNWLWGGNDGVSMNVWNPANFSVAYAATAGSATTATSAASVSGTGSNGYGNRTVSTGDPSGGADGDIWFKY